jgi:hypothetical protein
VLLVLPSVTSVSPVYSIWASSFVTLKVPATYLTS